MSEINTNGLDVNYPIPGKNNSSQGFRDNFSIVKTNLDTAGSEITDLQNKVVLKAALENSSVNNDMANTLMSNTLTRGFRASTYNLGNNISGSLQINVNQADIQYGTITANTIITFAGWAPSGTGSNVEVRFSISNANAYVSFPNTTNDSNGNTYTGMKRSMTSVENFYSNVSTFTTANVTYTNSVKAPANINELNYVISSVDCGTTLDITPTNRPRETTQIITGTPNVANLTSTGTITANTASATVTGSGTLFTTELVTGRVILTNANVVIGTVQAIANNTSLTLTTNGAANVSAAAYHRQLPVGSPGDKKGTTSTDGTYMYICTADYDGTTAIWKRISPSSY